MPDLLNWLILEDDCSSILGLESWMITGRSPRAKERYLTLLEENPELLQYVPLKHIASYLWITPQSLSRIRAELGRRKKDQ